MTEIDLNRVERSSFRAAADTGLWDILLASVFAIFAVAVLLSGRLGDFWIAAAEVPVLVAAYLIIRVVHTRVVVPRVGVVRFGQYRQSRLRKFTLIMALANIVAVVAGMVAASSGVVAGAYTVPLVLSLILLAGCSLAAFLLEIPRVYFYGVLLAGAPLVGEGLFQRGYASHHGFPVVFGAAAFVILATGIVRFARFLPPKQGGPEVPFLEEFHD